MQYVQIAVRRIGEAGKAAADDDWDKDAAIPTLMILANVPTAGTSTAATAELDAEGYFWLYAC